MNFNLLYGGRKALLATFLAASMFAAAQQGVTPPSAPPPGTVPVTSQTPVVPGAEQGAPATGPAVQGKAERNARRRQSKAARARDKAVKQKDPVTSQAEKAPQPQS